MIRVCAVHGEPTCYHVESSELQCVEPQCSKLYRRLPASFVWFSSRQREFLRGLGLLARVDKRLGELAERYSNRPGRRPGDQCPRCGGQLDVRFHRVDISAYGLNGWCSCEFFAFSLGPKLDKLGKAERGAGLYRCHHIWAARDFALDLSLKAHEAKAHRKFGREVWP
jgi:hypothetical protein